MEALHIISGWVPDRWFHLNYSLFYILVTYMYRRSALLHSCLRAHRNESGISGSKRRALLGRHYRKANPGNITCYDIFNRLRAWPNPRSNQLRILPNIRLNCVSSLLLFRRGFPLSLHVALFTYINPSSKLESRHNQSRPRRHLQRCRSQSRQRTRSPGPVDVALSRRRERRQQAVERKSGVSSRY